VLHIRDFPDDLHRDANAEAALHGPRGEPLRELVIRAVEREVAKLKAERERKGKRR
jgi:hypothetical protein